MAVNKAKASAGHDARTQRASRVAGGGRLLAAKREGLASFPQRDRAWCPAIFKGPARTGCGATQMNPCNARASSHAHAVEAEGSVGPCGGCAGPLEGLPVGCCAADADDRLKVQQMPPVNPTQRCSPRPGRPEARVGDSLGLPVGARSRAPMRAPLPIVAPPELVAHRRWVLRRCNARVAQLRTAASCVCDEGSPGA